MKLSSHLLLFLAFIIFCSGAYAQKNIHGYIRDKSSGEPLPAANLQITGTFDGTISNENGAYNLQLMKVPATVLVSYIGYASDSIRVNANSPEKIDFRLEPVSYQMEPIVVTGEDPAVRIMREVIRRKQIWRAKLNTYKVQAYTRQRLENDSSIVSIMESISEAFWDKQKGPREVILSRRQTSNMSASQNFAAASYVANFYDDDIEILGFRMIGPTHPKALDYYDFKLEGQRLLDKKIVYDISVTPRTKLQPAFVGTISVLDQDYAMIDVNLKPSEAILFPAPIQRWNVFYKQQFSNFGKEFWLPVDVRIEGEIKIGMVGLNFPPFKYHQISRLTGYQVNVPLPDSLYREKDIITVDSSAADKENDSLFVSAPEVIPLSYRETTAYETLDSTMTLEKAFKPTGVLARFVEISSDDGQSKKGKNANQGLMGRLVSGFRPILGFNRVEALHAGLRYNLPGSYGIEGSILGGYDSGPEEKFWGADIKFPLVKKPAIFSKTSYYAGIDSRFRSQNYSSFLNSINTLLGYDDYFDYYRNRRFRTAVGTKVPWISATATFGVNIEQHASIKKSTDYNLPGRTITQRINPAIPEGMLRSVEFRLVYGDDYVPFGLAGQNRLEFYVEKSDPSLLASDYSFTRYQTIADIRINTFLRRRLLPNTLDLHLVAGTATGSLPLQRMGILDGTLQVFSPFGVFRTVDGHPLEGEKYAALFWEHNFRTVPFEIIGLRYLAKKNISIILHGASGRTWLSEDSRNQIPFSGWYTDKMHHELGISLNGLFGLFRLDLTRSLTDSHYYFGAGFSRIF